MKTFASRFLAALLFVFSCVGLHAQALSAPTGKVILTIAGAVSKTNMSNTAVFDAAMIDALPVHSIKTNTPWFKDAVTFSGPLLQDVLNAVGAKGEMLTIKALNDYQIQVPLSDAQKYQTILARKVDGKVLSVRDKGPLFLIYPFDAVPELKNDIYYGRSIWQIASITVK